MRFITEDDLRTIYKNQPFLSYEVDPDASLTPAARQFLVDRGIDIYSDDPALTAFNDPRIQPESTAAEPVEERTWGGAVSADTVQIDATRSGTEKTDEASVFADNRSMLKFIYRVKEIETAFLIVAKELMAEDVCVAQQLTDLMKHFARIRSIQRGTLDMPDLECEACSGINGDNFSCWLGDCFDVTEFHLQLPNARVILELQRLRTAVNLFILDLPDMVDEQHAEQATDKVIQIVNTLSYIICKAFGGKSCQR